MAALGERTTNRATFRPDKDVSPPLTESSCVSSQLPDEERPSASPNGITVEELCKLTGPTRADAGDVSQATGNTNQLGSVIAKGLADRLEVPLELLLEGVRRGWISIRSEQAERLAEAYKKVHPDRPKHSGKPSADQAAIEQPTDAELEETAKIVGNRIAERSAKVSAWKKEHQTKEDWRKYMKEYRARVSQGA